MKNQFGCDLRIICKRHWWMALDRQYLVIPHIPIFMLGWVIPETLTIRNCCWMQREMENDPQTLYDSWGLHHSSAGVPLLGASAGCILTHWEQGGWWSSSLSIVTGLQVSLSPQPNLMAPLDPPNYSQIFQITLKFPKLYSNNMTVMDLGIITAVVDFRKIPCSVQVIYWNNYNASFIISLFLAARALVSMAVSELHGAGDEDKQK